MSWHRYQPEMRRCISRFAFSILGGLLLASQLVLPSHAFARSVRTAISADPPTSQSFALSEVSVVRLVYSYNAKPATKGTTAGTPVLCTSIGVLVKSIPANTSSTLNTSVLTDGSILNTAPASCAPSGSSSRSKTSTTYALSSINVYANDAYTGNTPASALLGTYTVAANNAPLCFATPCMNGAFFFSFHTDQLQPTLNVASTNTLQQFGIALTSQASTTAHSPMPLTNIAAAMAFLNPTQVTLDVTSSQNEAGMPFINTTGQMVAMHLQNAITLTSADYNAFVAQHPALNNALPNTLQIAWENGIAAYYSHNYHDAIKDFQIVEGLNPNFVAARAFELSATALSNTQSNSSIGVSNTSNGNTTFFGTFLVIGSVAGFWLLVVLLIIVSTRALRRHELARSEAEQTDSQKNAEREILQQEITQQLNTSVEMTNHESFIQGISSRKQKVSIINPSIPIDHLCSNCGQAVPVDAIYSTNCHFVLSPTSGDTSPALEFPGIEKAQPSSVTTSQPQRAPVKEKVLDDLAIQKALKRLWDEAEQ